MRIADGVKLGESSSPNLKKRGNSSKFSLSSVHFSGLDQLARNLFAGGVGRSREILDKPLQD